MSNSVHCTLCSDQCKNGGVRVGVQGWGGARLGEGGEGRVGGQQWERWRALLNYALCNNRCKSRGVRAGVQG